MLPVARQACPLPAVGLPLAAAHRRLPPLALLWPLLGVLLQRRFVTRSSSFTKEDFEELLAHRAITNGGGCACCACCVCCACCACACCPRRRCLVAHCWSWLAASEQVSKRAEPTAKETLHAQPLSCMPASGLMKNSRPCNLLSTYASYSGAQRRQRGAAAAQPPAPQQVAVARGAAARAHRAAPAVLHAPAHGAVRTACCDQLATCCARRLYSCMRAQPEQLHSHWGAVHQLGSYSTTNRSPACRSGRITTATCSGAAWCCCRT